MMGIRTNPKTISSTAGVILDAICKVKYTSDFNGIVFRTDGGVDAIMFSSTNHTAVDQDIVDIEIPTVTDTGLDILSNLGGFIVNDTYTVTPDPSLEKTIKISVYVDNASGSPEILVFNKTEGEYGPPPLGKTFAADLKEYTCPAGGSTLTKINDWIT